MPKETLKNDTAALDQASQLPFSERIKARSEINIAKSVSLAIVALLGLAYTLHRAQKAEEVCEALVDGQSTHKLSRSPDVMRTDHNVLALAEECRQRLSLEQVPDPNCVALGVLTSVDNGEDYTRDLVESARELDYNSCNPDAAGEQK